MSAAGALLFARYAYPPNELGYCGPAGAAAMLEPAATRDLERRARQFEGAWSYLEFIAESAGIADPLDVAVVEAYWLGNDLLRKVDSGALLARLLDRFRGQIGGGWRETADRALPHHSFQVFEVYPWARLLAARGSPDALAVLEQCRIRTARVLSVDGENAVVESAPLVWDGAALTIGAPRPEPVRWSTGGRSLIDAPAPGDRVAVHWDWVCDVVTDEQADRVESLEALGRRNLAPP
jgi:Family of unknown function (DUF6390)